MDIREYKELKRLKKQLKEQERLKEAQHIISNEQVTTNGSSPQPIAEASEDEVESFKDFHVVCECERYSKPLDPEKGKALRILSYAFEGLGTDGKGSRRDIEQQREARIKSNLQKLFEIQRKVDMERISFNKSDGAEESVNGAFENEESTAKVEPQHSNNRFLPSIFDKVLGSGPMKILGSRKF